jgi:hypothetical protein
MNMIQILCYFYDQIRTSGKRPREAYTGALTSVAKKFKSSETQAAVLIKLPSYSEVRCQLTRHRAFRCIPVPDPLSIPDALRATLRGRTVSDDDINKNETFLLHTGLDGKLLLFCALTELALIHQSEYLICDGTFEMAPDSAYQLYTVHGIFKCEGMALMWALLPNKLASTYKELFSAVRSALVASYGDIGATKTFVTDFEIAAIKSIQDVFPECTVKGCSFHYRQAINRHVQQEGLKTAYEQTEPPEMRAWIRQIMALTSLPTFAIPLVWNFLKTPPPTGNIDLDRKAQALALYVDNTWINGQFPTSLWSHFDNLGPRTTNLAEGWHNGLNTHFGMPHPSLRTFLDWLQNCQFEVQSRGLQLAAGRPPKQRAPIYDRLDANLMAAKVKFSMNVGNIFLNMFPSESFPEMFKQETVAYLNYISYLLLG